MDGWRGKECFKRGLKEGRSTKGGDAKKGVVYGNTVERG